MNPNQQFCLRWNNHQSTLISVFEALLESGTLVDCTLAAEGQYLKAHKVVLSACSPYLGMLLSQDFEKHPILILKDVKFAQLKSMLDYMYRGEVNISQDQLGTFLKAAESLQIKGLTDSGGANSNNNQGSEAEDYNARHRKHLALMAAAAARSRSPIIEQQSQHQHQRWMNNGGGMHHEMMRDGSISPSPRKRKRPRRPSLGHNPLQNGHDEMPLQPLIQQAQATNNNVLAQSLAAPPLSHPPKCVTPPPAHTPDIKRDEEEVSSPSPKLEPIEHNNNDSVPFKPLANEKNPVASPDSKESGHVNNNHSNASLDGGHSEDEGEEERKKEETEEENNEEMLDEDIEEDMDEENSNGGNQAQRATMANAHWLMTDALPNSDSFQDSKDITQIRRYIYLRNLQMSNICELRRDRHQIELILFSRPVHFFLSEEICTDDGEYSFLLVAGLPRQNLSLPSTFPS
ncbi:hypothetical protein M8J77_012799 [Diaphorina citri]|nr:hypothetical protein M8J77_012799 [Diaphorina citri]